MNNKEKGFTLIELMAVLVILGILATVVVVSVDPVFQRANLEKIRADMANTNKALEIYKFNELSLLVFATYVILDSNQKKGMFHYFCWDILYNMSIFNENSLT